MARASLLIVDDEEGIRESVGLILSEDDYALRFASSGEEALRRLAAEPFDLVLMDIKMPKVDGLEVLRAMRRRGFAMPVLFLTAYQSVELAKEAARLGAVDYLPKPFDRDQLLDVVRSALSLR
jgi:DNA-binding NtrC family response regulator